MSLSAAKTIATALFSSVLDYCNSLLHDVASNVALLAYAV